MVGGGIWPVGDALATVDVACKSALSQASSSEEKVWSIICWAINTSKDKDSRRTLAVYHCISLMNDKSWAIGTVKGMGSRELEEYNNEPAVFILSTPRPFPRAGVPSAVIKCQS